jgi:hypothetical protein
MHDREKYMAQRLEYLTTVHLCATDNDIFEAIRTRNQQLVNSVVKIRCSPVVSPMLLYAAAYMNIRIIK